MKKIAILIISVVFNSSLFSQGVRMGLTASPQMSWMKSDAAAVSSDGSQFGFNFGLLTDFFFTERYSFSTGLMINNTGGKLKYNDTVRFKTNDLTYNLNPGASIKYKIQYLDIPLAFRMESNQIGYFQFYAQFGLTNQIRLGVSADIDGEESLTEDDVTATKTISLSGVGCKDEINLFNMGYNIGAGMNYYFSKNTALTFGLLYTNGFIDATNNQDNNDNISLRSITLKIGVLF
jgi:hypothetical protein